MATEDRFQMFLERNGSFWGHLSRDAVFDSNLSAKICEGACSRVGLIKYNVWEAIGLD